MKIEFKCYFRKIDLERKKIKVERKKLDMMKNHCVVKQKMKLLTETNWNTEMKI